MFDQNNDKAFLFMNIKLDNRMLYFSSSISDYPGDNT